LTIEFFSQGSVKARSYKIDFID